MPLLLAGLALTALSWITSWGRLGSLSEYAFFPLWIGYILSINGIAEACFKTSLLRRMGHSFLYLFLISVPMWWFFEGMNQVVHNWTYLFASSVPSLRYTLQASINFSTVVPAALSTAFLFDRLIGDRMSFGNSWTFAIGRSASLWLALGGVAGFLAIWCFPNEAFPLVWIAPIGILESLAILLGLPSLLSEMGRGRYRPAVAVMIGTLFTGFWWELWNFHALPKWIYTIPYVGFWKVFEMPILGYLGYPFFGLVVLSYTALMMGALRRETFASLFVAKSG